jgi:RNA polymerase sigma-70 factor, ECF subfamily
MDHELELLLQRCRSGDELAWEALVRRFQGRVHALVCHYVRSREDARDVAQEVFVRVWRSLPNFEQDASFVPWLLRVARTTAIDHVRRRNARPPAQDLPADEAYDLADPSLDPSAQAEQRSENQLVRRALDGISRLHREILLLRDIQGLALHEVADMLGIPIGTAKSRASRARVELAEAVIALRADDGGIRSRVPEGGRS